MTQVRRPSRQEELEGLFLKFSDIPREVIVKEDVLRRGVAFAKEALIEREEHLLKTYGGYLFSYDMVRPEEMEQQEVWHVPPYLELKGEPYGLRGRVILNTRVNPRSQYIVDRVDGKLRLCDRSQGTHQPVAELWDYPPLPPYWRLKFEDGTPYREVVRDNNRGVFVTCFLQCQHWGPKEECKFCDINENARKAKARGALSLKRPYQDVEKVAEVIQEIFVNSWDKRPPECRPCHISLNGGTVNRKLAGLEELDFYLGYVRAIREVIGNKTMIGLATHPYGKAEMRKMREAGVDRHSVDIEVWDKRLFGIICPGKQHTVGWDEWVKCSVEEVEEMGIGNVNPGMVTGVEMSQPWGFRTMEEGLKSNEEAFEFFMSRGAVPRLASWCVEPGSGLRGQEPPPLEYFVRVDRLWYEKWRKYRLPPPNHLLVGPGITEWAQSGFLDMGWP